MKAFENTEVSRDRLLCSLARHRAADNLVGGRYWGNGQGCAVGCSIHDFRPGHESNHSLYPKLFGIPEKLAQLEDDIFERLPREAAYEWPERFVSAINPGADLRQVEDRFVLWLLSDTKSPLSEWADEPWMAGVADLYRRRLAGEEPDTTEWDAAADAAAAAAVDADAAADAAAAAVDADADAAADAAAAAAGFKAAAAAWNAAESAVWTASRTTTAAARAAEAAKEAAWAAMADALVQILEETEK